MIAGVPYAELAWLAAIILAGGVLAGFLSGLFGIGGGAIIVPVLYEVFRVAGVPDEIRMQLCIGTSLAYDLVNLLRISYIERLMIVRKYVVTLDSTMFRKSTADKTAGAGD